MNRFPTILLAGLLTAFLTACGGSDDEETSSVDTTALPGQADCVADPDLAVICGTVLAADGITPLVSAEISLVTAGKSVNTGLVNQSTRLARGVADPDKCITDIAGEYSCLLPTGVSGDVEINVESEGFNSQRFTAFTTVGNTTNTGSHQLASNTDQQWLVIPGTFDGVQVLLSQLKGCTLNNQSGEAFDPLSDVPEDARASDDCTDKGLLVLNDDDVDSPYYVDTFFLAGNWDDFDAVFVNCDANYSDTSTDQALIDFVDDGKHVYFSDLSSDWLENAFPGNITFAGNDTSTGDLTATVTSTGLASVIGTTVDIAFDLSVWTAIDSVQPEVNTFIEADITSVSTYSGVKPITVGWKEDTVNSGCVFYTSYHVEGATTGSDQELAIKYLVQNISSACQ